METTKVFKKNLIAYQKPSRLIINQGGTSSSKTYSILQLLFLIAYQQPRHRIISVVSYALPHLKLGAIRDFNKILLSFGIIPDEVCKKTDMEYYINNSIVEFFGTDNLGKVHGPRRDILFINEANNIKYDIYTQLSIRTRECVFIDYNPVVSFWVNDEVIPSFPHEFIKSNYKDNDYLDPLIVAQIESRQKNENWWKVYGLGEMGLLEGMIYTNWDFGDFDTSLPFGFGLDFGYHPDPDAMIKVAIDQKEKKIYTRECLYTTNQQVSDLKRNIGLYATPNDLILADSADPRLIAELKQARFNIRGVVKYDGSVIEGIRLVQDYKIIVDKDSVNLTKELRNYTWNDKKSGIPNDAFNHLLDCLRYYVQTMTRKRNYF